MNECVFYVVLFNIYLIGGTGPSAIHMPLHLYMMFKPAPIPPYLPPVNRHLYLRNYQNKKEKSLDIETKRNIVGISSFMYLFNSSENNNNNDSKFDRSELLKNDISFLSLAGKRLKQYKKENMRKIEDEELKKWNPHQPNENVTKNAFNTLFISNLSSKTTEETLRPILEKYGTILSIRVVRDRKGKSRKYCFIEFENEQSLQTAFKDLKQTKSSIIDGSSVIVDVERGRTVSTWKPRRLGGDPSRTSRNIRSSFTSSNISNRPLSKPSENMPSSETKLDSITAPSSSIAMLSAKSRGAFTASSSNREPEKNYRTRSLDRRHDGNNRTYTRDDRGHRKRDRSSDRRKRDRSPETRHRGGNNGWERRPISGTIPNTALAAVQPPKKRRSRSRQRYRR